MQTPAERVAELSQRIRAHDHAYYVLSAPTITDAEYDALMAELRHLESTYPELVQVDSPTQRVPAELDVQFTKVAHPQAMLSLANAFDERGVCEWRDRVYKLLGSTDVAWTAEPKIDGLAIALTYHHGRLVRAATRGDGTVGEDVTANVRTIKTVPWELRRDSATAVPAELEVRGEIYMRSDDFAELNARLRDAGEKTAANPRNAASGSLRQKDPAITKTRPLRFFAYAIGPVAGGRWPDTQWGTLCALRDLGFDINEDAREFGEFADVLGYAQAWMQKRDILAYEVDGIVFKVNSLSQQRELGVAGRDPRWALAYKFPARETSSILKNITVAVGRTGVLTPAAEIEPVQLSGVTVRNASLHNADLIEKLDLRIGDRVILKRAGDVIPYIIGPMVAARSGHEVVWQMPTHCPACGTAAVRPEGEVAWRCPNSDECPEQRKRRIEYAVSRDALDIVGFGEQQARLLVERGLIHDVADIFTLQPTDFADMDGFGEKKITNLMQAITDAKMRPVTRVLVSLGIHMVGTVVAQLLINHFGSLQALADADVVEISRIEGIGPIKAQNVVEFFARPGNRALIAKLATVGVQVSGGGIQKQSDVLAGQIVVVTGTLPLGREQVEALVAVHGGKATGSVSKKTSFVLAGTDPGGSKISKATELGVPVKSWDEFVALVGAIELPSAPALEPPPPPTVEPPEQARLF